MLNLSSGTSESPELPGFPTHQPAGESTGSPTKSSPDSTPGELYTSVPVTSPPDTPVDIPSKPEDLPSRFNGRKEETVRGIKKNCTMLNNHVIITDRDF